MEAAYMGIRKPASASLLRLLRICHPDSGLMATGSPLLATRMPMKYKLSMTEEVATLPC